MENTATKAIEVKEVSFKDRISNMDEGQLRELASEEFGLNIDGQLKKPVIINQLLRIFEETKNAAHSLNEESAALFLIADENEKLVAVKFIPLDFPHAPVECTPDGGLGIGEGSIKGSPKGVKRLSQMPRFKLRPGETYKLPIRVIKFLESLTYRDSKPIHDPVTGMITGNQPVIKPRFMLQVILSEDQMRAMGTTH